MQLFATVGRIALAWWRESMAIAVLFTRAVRDGRQIDVKDALGHAYSVGNRSLFFVTMIMACTGAIMTLQVAAQSQRILGDLSLVGPAFLQLLIGEFGPTIVAMMIAARSGAGMAAELGSMRITEQVDAIRMAGVEPWGYLVAPRIVGCVIGMLPIAVLGTCVAYGMGGLALRHRYGLGWETYLDTSLVHLSDVVIGCIKAVAYGVVIPTVACHMGLTAQGGAPGVGRATTRAVIGASAGVLLCDLVIGTMGYLVLAR